MYFLHIYFAYSIRHGINKEAERCRLTVGRTGRPPPSALSIYSSPRTTKGHCETQLVRRRRR